MSFLLRKPSRGVPSARAPSHRGAATKSSVARPHRGGGAQQQQLLQRRPAATQQQRMTHSTATKAQQVSKQEKEELQGVISMEEVMSDLRVLEQQQRDSQKKLATIKRTKQAKLKQRSALDSKLSSLKYANGEQRAQLTRARDVLSRSTRELGSVALRADKSGDALKGFNSRLDKALLSSRILRGVCRKVDSEMIALRNKKAIIQRFKMQVAERLDAARKRHDDAKNREASLRKGIQEEKVKIKILVEKISIIRLDVTGLAQDLSTAEQMAASTKMRAESIAVEAIEEDKRHEAVMQEMRSKLEAASKQLDDRKARDVAVQKEIELKKTQLREAWKRCVQYQKEEGHELSPEPTDNGPAPSLDAKKLNVLLTQDRAALLSNTAERDRLQETLASSNKEISDLGSKAPAATEEAETIRKGIQDAQNAESARRKEYDQSLEELETERCSVSDLRRSVVELEESNRSGRKRLDSKYSEQAETTEKRRSELEASKADLATALTTIQDIECAYVKDEADNVRLVEEAKRGADDARSAFEEARHEANLLETASGDDIQKEVQDIQEAQRILAEDTNDEIAQLCEEYPALQQIDLDYDADKSLEDQADEALFDLKAVCEARIEQSKTNKEVVERKRLEEEAAERKSLALEKENEMAERNAKLRAQRKEAEASQRRREERRNERRRKEAKQRQALLGAEEEAVKPARLREDGKHKRRSSSSTSGGILTSTQDKHVDSDSERPPSQKRIRFEDEEDVNSLITKELGTSSRTSDKKRTYGKNRPSAQSRRETSSALKPKRLASSLKESGRPRSASSSDKMSKARDETSRSSMKRAGGVSSSRTRQEKKPESTMSRSSKDCSSRSSSLASESRPTKRQKNEAESISTAPRTSGSKSKGRPSSTTSSSKAEPKHKAQNKQTHSSSFSTNRASNHESRKPTHDDSLTTHTSSRSGTSKSSSLKSQGVKPEERSAVSSRSKKSSSHLVKGNDVGQSVSNTSKSSSRKSRESKSDDSRSASSRGKKASSLSTKADDGKSASSRARTSNSSSRERHEPTKSESSTRKASQKSKSQSSSRSVSSQKSSRIKSSHKSSRSVLDPQQKSSCKRKASRSDHDGATQASGISTMERATKSRRRKKKDGPTTNKSKMSSLAMDDVDFHF